MAQDELGRTKVAEEVVAIIAGLAATEIEGVAGMSGGIVSGLPNGWVERILPGA